MTNLDDIAEVPKELRNKVLKITGGRPLSDGYMNQFFKLFTTEYLLEFEKLFNKLEPKLKFIKMSPEEFMSKIKESYTRYQEFKNIDPFTPMDKKAFKYVTEYIQESIDKVYTMVARQKK